MDRIPLINPNLVQVVTAKAERTPEPVLRAEVISSERIKAEPKSSQTRDNFSNTTNNNSANNKNTTDNQNSSKNESASKNEGALRSENASKNENPSKNENASKEAQQYKVVLKIGNQRLETISTEDFKKGSQLDIKVSPGPELKIITLHNKTPTDVKSNTKNLQTPVQAAMQQLLADRIPKIQSQGLSQLIDQLSQLMSGSKSLAANTALIESSTASKLNPLLGSLPDSASKTLETTKLEINKRGSLIQNQNGQTTKQALANLAYQSLSKTTSPTVAIPATSSPQSSLPLQQVKDWLQQLPSSSDISNSTGLRNALNNTGVRAETQLSQLAQQFASLSKGSQSAQSTYNSVEEKSANTIFQQLQKIQQKIFSKSPEPLSQTDLGSIVKNTAKSLESNSQNILSNLKNGTLNNKNGNLNNKIDTTTANPTLNATTTLSAATSSTAIGSTTISPTTSSWQNPLLNSQAYSTLQELMKDPLLQNPSSNTKFALGQMLNNLANQADSQVRIPLNWPERNGNDAVILRTLQNLLGHIEREQGLQLQQSDSNVANNPSLTTSQNQQWLPLLIHHQQQLQLIEFFIDKEEKKNAQGEKKNHWFINLHFDLPKLGELGIEISMFENECNTTFWSESSSTLSQLSYHVQPLRQRLTEQGIIVSDVQSRHGTLAKRKHNIEQRLVDIET